MCSIILVFVGHMPSGSKGVVVSHSHVAEGDAGVRNVPPFSPYTDRSIHLFRKQNAPTARCQEICQAPDGILNIFSDAGRTSDSFRRFSCRTIILKL